jgi:hypothetical protein
VNGQSRRQMFWRTLPLIGLFVWEWEAWHKERTQPCYRLWPRLQVGSQLLPYPIDMWPLMDLPGQILDATGVLYTLSTDMFPGIYHPTDIAQYALVNWNTYVTTMAEKYRQTFMIQAQWLVAHETRLADDAGGWLIPFPNHNFYAPKSWLSALTQGVSISVLVRAYQLTSDDVFLQVARRAVRTFELDILDGGVSASVGDNGVFFEEVAVYPAAHILNGYILSLFGLYDYVALSGDSQIDALIQRSIATLHTLIDDFDLGYGSRYDLLLKSPTSYFYHALHITLLEALAQYSGCQHCATLAQRWASYQHGFKPLVNYLMRRIGRYRRRLRIMLDQSPKQEPTYEQTS